MMVYPPKRPAQQGLWVQCRHLALLDSELLELRLDWQL